MICSQCGNKIRGGYVEIDGKTICTECYSASKPKGSDNYREMVLENRAGGIFGNIGGKIKALAKAIYGIGIVVSVLSGFIMFMSGMDMRNGGGLVFGGILVMTLGAIFSWVGSFITYGFGELVENSCIQTELMLKKEMENTKETGE